MSNKEELGENISAYYLAMTRAMIDQRRESNRIISMTKNLPEEVVQFIKKTQETAEIFHDTALIAKPEFNFDRFVRKLDARPELKRYFEDE
jgi:hypothetical protein